VENITITRKKIIYLPPFPFLGLGLSRRGFSLLSRQTIFGPTAAAFPDEK
jgi:hypothetical protein